MKLTMKFGELDWWFWAVILVAIGLGLLGFGWGFKLAFWVSLATLVVSFAKDRNLASLNVQVRIVWLGLVLLAFWPPTHWLFYLLFVGMILVVFFDRCGIALVLGKMPWNKAKARG